MKRQSFSLLLLIIFLGACAPLSGGPGTATPTALVLAHTGAYPASSAPAAYPAAGTPSAEAKQPVQAPPILQDGLGREVTLKAMPKRIVSLAPSNTEIVYALGAGNLMVGRDDFSDYPEAAKALPSVGGSMGKYNLEQITALKPDLVLASELNPKELVKSLDDLGLTVFYVANPTDLNGMYGNLRLIAALTGTAANAEALIEGLQKRVQTVEGRLTGITSRPSAFYELDASDPSKPYTSGPGTFVDQLIQQAGGKNIGASLGSSWAQISQEELLVQNPDIILLGDAAYGVSPDSLAKRPGWDGLKAVKDGKIFTFDDNLVSRPTPRLVDGLETLAKLIHPEAFQ